MIEFCDLDLEPSFRAFVNVFTVFTIPFETGVTFTIKCSSLIMTCCIRVAIMTSFKTFVNIKTSIWLECTINSRHLLIIISLITLHHFGDSYLALKPALHSHSYEPSVLMHIASSSQSLISLSPHSSMSAQSWPSPTYPSSHSHVNEPIVL